MGAFANAVKNTAAGGKIVLKLKRLQAADGSFTVSVVKTEGKTLKVFGGRGDALLQRAKQLQSGAVRPERRPVSAVRHGELG